MFIICSTFVICLTTRFVDFYCVSEIHEEKSQPFFFFLMKISTIVLNVLQILFRNSDSFYAIMLMITYEKKNVCYRYHMNF